MVDHHGVKLIQVANHFWPEDQKRSPQFRNNLEAEDAEKRRENINLSVERRVCCWSIIQVRL